MIKRIRTWWDKQKDLTKKTAGLAEKEASTQRKYDVAMSILNRREKDVPVKINRRKKDEFNLDLKHA